MGGLEPPIQPAKRNMEIGDIWMAGPSPAMEK